jgi:hypothetical protein
MSKGKHTMITASFLRLYNREIAKASKVEGYYTGSPRRAIADLAREKLGFSENTLSGDIWLSIWNAYRKLLERD